MLTGKRFRLNAQTLGIESVGGDRIPMHVPAHAVVEITSGQNTYDMRTV